MLTTMLIATHAGDHDRWGPGPLVFLLLLAVVATAVWFVWRRPHRLSGGGGGVNVLAERFARGEIDEEEYRSRLAVLRERRRR